MSKEREAFEALQNQKIFKWFEFDSSVNEYVLKDISATLEKLTALAELNYGWDMWQASKAQAVPEGFVLVPKEPTPKMIDSTWDYDEDIYGMSSNERNRFIYKTMIEAQKPSSTSGCSNEP